MNPKLPLDRHIYTLTAVRSLNTNALGKLLLRSTLRVRLGSCFNCFRNGQLGLHQNQCTFQKIPSLSMGGAHSRVEAYVASPTSPSFVGKQLHSSVPHTATVDISCLQITAPMANCVFQHSTKLLLCNYTPSGKNVEKSHKSACVCMSNVLAFFPSLRGTLVV